MNNYCHNKASKPTAVLFAAKFARNYVANTSKPAAVQSDVIQTSATWGAFAGEKMKKSILFLSFLLILTSCKTAINLQNEKNADEQIIEYLKSKKIVFIGEHHSTVFPILYLTQNMETFYNTGVRYLFLEEEGDGFFPAENYDNYRLKVVPPWCTFGWKYEYHLMELEVARVNQLHPSDPINVIFPEEGITWPEDMNDATKVLNARDAQAQKTIIEIMDKAKPEDKAIIFYGSGHGMKNPDYYHGDQAL